LRGGRGRGAGSRGLVFPIHKFEVRLPYLAAA
jgi:hypothetical protein